MTEDEQQLVLKALKEDTSMTPIVKLEDIIKRPFHICKWCYTCVEVFRITKYRNENGYSDLRIYVNDVTRESYYTLGKTVVTYV